MRPQPPPPQHHHHQQQQQQAGQRDQFGPGSEWGGSDWGHHPQQQEQWPRQPQQQQEQWQPEAAEAWQQQQQPGEGWQHQGDGWQQQQQQPGDSWQQHQGSYAESTWQTDESNSLHQQQYMEAPSNDWSAHHGAAAAPLRVSEGAMPIRGGQANGQPMISAAEDGWQSPRGDAGNGGYAWQEQQPEPRPPPPPHLGNEWSQPALQEPPAAPTAFRAEERAVHPVYISSAASSPRTRHHAYFEQQQLSPRHALADIPSSPASVFSSHETTFESQRKHSDLSIRSLPVEKRPPKDKRPSDLALQHFGVTSSILEDPEVGSQASGSPKHSLSNEPKLQHPARRAVARFGFGGKLVVAAMASSVVRVTAVEINEDEFDAGGSFRPLLGVEWARQNPAQVADMLEARAGLVSKAKTDGALAGSTRLLWSLLAALVRVKGKRTPVLSTAGPPEGSFENVALDLLALAPFADIGNRDKQTIAPRATQQSGGRPFGVETEANFDALAELEMLLLSGDQERAVLCAMNNGLWAEALVIAHFVSATAHRRVVLEFARRTQPLGSPMSTVFHLMAGKGTEAVSESASDFAIEDCWKQTLRAILANRTPSDENALLTFGDRLLGECGSVAAAHICYVCAGHSAMESGPDSRLLLVGGDHDDCRGLLNPHSIMCTEALLFADELAGRADCAPAIEAFQAFRLVFAMQLSDLGLEAQAKEWLAAIKQGEAAFGAALREQFDAFEARLEGRRLWPLEGESKSTPNGFAGPENAHVRTKLRFEEEPSPLVSFSLSAQQTQRSDEGFADPFDAQAAPPDLPYELASPPAADELPLRLPSRAISAPAVLHKMDLGPPSPSPPLPPKPTPVPVSNHAAAAAGGGANGAAFQPRPPSAGGSPTTAAAKPPGTAPHRSGISDKIDEARGWLVQRIFGLGNATVANTGAPMTAYYDEKRKVWVFPGDDPDALVPKPVGPPPKVSGSAPPPQLRAAGAPPALKNRYVVPT